jgi:hypothetical protein
LFTPAIDEETFSFSRYPRRRSSGGFDAIASMAAEDCVVTASFFAFLGIALALALTAIGSGYGTAKSAIGVFAVCAMHPEFI